MKKLVLKTALITLSASIVMVFALFGILSLAAPGVMMNFTDKLGLTGLSGDYAYQEYERSGDLDCLTRSFLIAADHKQDGKADDRFEALRTDKNFEDYCAKASVPDITGVPKYDFRAYLFGQAARVKYRLAKTAESKAAVIDFAVEATGAGFALGNPVISLAAEAARAKDKLLCGDLADRLKAEDKFERNDLFNSIVAQLESIAAE